MEALSLALLQQAANVEPLDWPRFLVGGLPWNFVLEVVVRSIAIFIFAIVVLRLLGKRGVANLSPFEFAILLAFGSIIGDSAFYHDVGVVFTMTAAVIITVLYRFFSWLTTTNDRVAEVTESTARQLVQHGTLEFKATRTEHLSHNDVFAMLRQAGVRQLGEVEYAFLETNGHLSVFLYPSGQGRPGLPIVPPLEVLRPAIFKPGDPLLLEGYYSCISCGLTQYLPIEGTFGRCPNCGRNHWITSVPGGQKERGAEYSMHQAAAPS